MRLSYADVAATAALACGVAALALGVADDGSGGGARAEQADTAVRADQADTAVRADQARNAGRLGGRPPRDFLSADRVALSPRLVKLRVGERKAVLRRKPFSLIASCERRGERVRVEVGARSEQRRSYLYFGGAALPLGPERRRPFLELISRRVFLGGQPFTLLAPRGRPLNGLVSAGVRLLRADCFASAGGFG